VPELKLEASNPTTAIESDECVLPGRALVGRHSSRKSHSRFFGMRITLRRCRRGRAFPPVSRFGVQAISYPCLVRDQRSVQSS
jgi:hypothetical protein